MSKGKLKSATCIATEDLTFLKFLPFNFLSKNQKVKEPAFYKNFDI